MHMYRQLKRSKVWYARFRASDGKWVSRSTGMIAKDKATQVAVQFERDARLAVVDGELAAAAVTRNAADMHKRVTGKELEFVSTRAYMQQFLEAKGTKSTEATVRSYDKTVRYFLAHLGAKANASIQKVKPQDVQTYIAKRMGEGSRPGTVKLDIRVLFAVFNRAMREGVCTLNPVATVDIPLAQSEVKKPFTLDEVEAILKACPGTEWKTLCLLAFYTGARMGDICDLAWENIDLDAVDPFIAYTQRKLRKAEHSFVKLPLHPDLKAWLLTYRASAVGNPKAPALPSMSKALPGGRCGLSQAFIGIMAKAGVDPCYTKRGKNKVPGKSFHSFRHTMVTNLESRQIAENVRMRMVGHANANVHRIYSHDDWGAITSAINGLPSISA